MLSDHRSLVNSWNNVDLLAAPDPDAAGTALSVRTRVCN